MKKVFDIDIVVIMFIIGEWIFCGIVSIMCGEFLVCFDRNDEFKVVWYSNIGIVI